MGLILSWSGNVLFLFILVIGFFSIAFGIPGTWIILVDAIAYGWITHFKILSVSILLLLTLLAISGEVLEYFLSLKGIKQAKPSKRVVLVSFLCGIVLAILMAPLLFGFGSILGALIGTFGGAFLMEFLSERRLGHAIHIGWKAFLGRLSGFLSKLLIATIMITFIIFQLFSK